jgi:hypothetical protein
MSPEVWDVVKAAGIPAILLGVIITTWIQIRAVKKGVQALLRDRLLQAFNHYLARGYITAGERDNIDNMYVQYEALGPNNVISDIYNQVRALPSIPPEAHPMAAHAIAQ